MIMPRNATTFMVYLLKDNYKSVVSKETGSKERLHSIVENVVDVADVEIRYREDVLGFHILRIEVQVFGMDVCSHGNNINKWHNTITIIYKQNQ